MYFIVSKKNLNTGCPLQGKIRENREFCGKKIPCREKSGNLEKCVKSGKNQGILQKHVREISGNFQLYYIYTDSFPIFQDIYIYNIYIYIYICRQLAYDMLSCGMHSGMLWHIHACMHLDMCVSICFMHVCMSI